MPLSRFGDRGNRLSLKIFAEVLDFLMIFLRSKQTGHSAKLRNLLSDKNMRCAQRYTFGRADCLTLHLIIIVLEISFFLIESLSFKPLMNPSCMYHECIRYVS